MNNYYIIRGEEYSSLSHYGVKGMKWGVRKDPVYSQTRSNYKAAKKAYSKSFNKAYNFSRRHPVTQFVKKSKNYEKSNSLWDDAYKKAGDVQSAKKDMKAAKQAAKKNSNVSSTAKKVAIGVAAAAAVAGVSYVALTRMNNKSAAIAKSRAMKVMRKYGAQKIKRGPTNSRWVPAENGLVRESKYTRRLTGHSGRVTKLGAARHRHQFHTRKAQETPLSWDYMSGTTPRGRHEKLAYDAGNEIADMYTRSNNVKIYNSGKINKLRRQKGPKVLRYK